MNQFFSAHEYIRARFLGAKNVRIEGDISNVSAKFGIGDVSFDEAQDFPVDSPFDSRKKELRGVWVTTVRNNDFPSRGGLDLAQFKAEFMAVIATCKAFNLNALFLQIRPEGDAFYPSGVNPWSMYLTGQQGVAPNWGDFDPLTWMISETHKAGMEFHAWLNPYRLTPTDQMGTSEQELLERLSPDHYVRRHPDWIYFFNGQLFLNPGVPAVTQFMVATVDEILQNYDVDAIHLDDFFYPYSYEQESDEGVVTVTFADASPDLETFHRYNENALPNIHVWREANINHLVYSLHETIGRYNRIHGDNVEFGISPFGVWASMDTVPGGSATSSGQLSSLGEYVNSKLWIDNGWIDYIVPQVYWSFNDQLAPFAAVCDWWNDVVAGSKTKLYIGLGLYLYEEESGDLNWQNPEEIINQIRFIRQLDNVSGFVFFTFHNLLPERATNDTMEQVTALLKYYLNQ